MNKPDIAITYFAPGFTQYGDGQIIYNKFNLLSQLPGSPVGKRLKIKKAIQVLKSNPKLRKLIKCEESIER